MRPLHQQQLPPKHNFNASFNYDWDLMNKKREIELLRPKEICPKRNHSFHNTSNDCDRSFHNRSFDRPNQENDKVSSRMQTEFGQLKNIIQKRCAEIEKQQRQQDLKISICLPQSKDNKPKEDTPQFNYYQTFKPIFAKLNTLIENSNTKDKERLVTLFDSLDQDSIQKQEPEQLMSLVEQLVKEFVIPSLEQKTPLKKEAQQSQYSSNKMRHVPSTQQFPIPSMEQSLDQINLFDIPFKNVENFYQQIKLPDSVFLEYQVVQSIALGDTLQHFNLVKHHSCKLISSQNYQIDVKQIKQSVLTDQNISLNDITIVPINCQCKKYIFILKYPSVYCKQIKQYVQLNTNCLLSKYQSGCSALTSYYNKQMLKKKLSCIQRLRQLNVQVKKLRRIGLLKGYKQLKNLVKPCQNNLLSKLILQSARQVKKDVKNNTQKLVLSIQKYLIKLQGCAFTQMNGNDDVMIMLQALQSECSVEKYLQQVTELLGDKVIVSILNLELQSLTSYLPEYGLVQEFFDQVGDLSKFETLYSLTLSVNTELSHMELENRHIWKVTNDIFMITCSNMKTNYLSKLALVLSNGLFALHQKYLEFFRYIRLKQDSYIQKVKSIFFSRWRSNQNNFIDQLRQELMEVKQDQDQQQRLIYQYEMEMQNLSIQNALKSKCLSSALLENTLSRRENEAQLKETFFKLWWSRTKNQRHMEQRTFTGLYLLEQSIQKVEKSQLDIAFREIAFSYNHDTIPTSPILKNTKRSFHTREQTRRSQEELEQSVLWDVHQMKINTPNNHKGQSLSPMTTMNTSFLLENESLYQYHSQRCTQQQKKKPIPSSSDQENVQTQNKIYSQRTKDFVRKISKQPNPRRANLSQPGSSFSFYDLQH